jgi:V/A-type H+-transporting ATPase subunit I
LNLGIAQFTVGPLNIGALLYAPGALAGKIIMFAGIAIFLVFNNPDKPFITRFFGLSIWEMYNFITGILGDVLSYLRLFALGLAGGLLGNAFNYIAFMLVTNADGSMNYVSPMMVFTIIILLVGHSLNLALSMIGSFVHPLRLTFVEFYKNIEFKGGGTAYKPFATTKLRENN